MRVFILGSLVFLPCLCAGALLADLRPKEAPGGKADPERDGKKPMTADDHENLHRQLAAESEANLKKIAELMEKVRNGLSKNQTGASTQNDQREVVRQLQELIDKVGKG